MSLRKLLDAISISSETMFVDIVESTVFNIHRANGNIIKAIETLRTI